MGWEVELLLWSVEAVFELVLVLGFIELALRLRNQSVIADLP